MLIKGVNKSTMFHFSPITVHKEVGGVSRASIYATGSLRGCITSLPHSISRFPMWQRDTKSHYFLKRQTKHAVWQSRSEKVRRSAAEEMREWGRKTKSRRRRGVVISPDLMIGHDSDSARLECTSVDSHTHIQRIHQQCLSVMLIHCAASVHFVFLRCCRDQDLLLLNLITETCYLSPLAADSGGTDRKCFS